MDVVINGEEYISRKYAEQSANEENDLIRKLQFQLMAARGFPELDFLRKLDIAELTCLFSAVLENKVYEKRLDVWRHEFQRLKADEKEEME